jgi:hypothetical protein
MKRRYLISISLLLIMFILITVFTLNKRAKTFEEAIPLSQENKMKIIAEDKTDKGSVVFCYNSDDDVLYTSFIRKKLFGYENLYSGVKCDVTQVSEVFGVSYTIFPPIKQTSLPIYFGVIGNDEVREIKVKESGTEDGGKNARIIETEDMRIWLIYMNGFKGSNFDIIGISEDGKEIVNISDVSPWKVDQEQVRSPYK